MALDFRRLCFSRRFCFPRCLSCLPCCFNLDFPWRCRCCAGGCEDLCAGFGFVPSFFARAASEIFRVLGLLGWPDCGFATPLISTATSVPWS
ncbi:unnamed protein product [Haemonchus placei]|uniref:Uncharacterized protein n=1 Tax=Haemonchus placei TaxID=6290 RepID=A0A3P7WU65_HAEPC|nr:unnamed protein product [Haemonchus placei]